MEVCDFLEASNRVPGLTVPLMLSGTVMSEEFVLMAMTRLSGTMVTGSSSDLVRPRASGN